MKQFFTTIALCFIACIALAQSVDKMPVLRVNFSGSFYNNMDYVNGHMTLTDVDGSVVELPAKFKTRGATAASYLSKPSFNMKLRNEDYTEEVDSALLGIRSCSSWILDAMAIDRICMRNRVAFDIWNEFSKLPYETDFGGRNGTEGRFVEVYINNVYRGIYCMTDRINRKLLNLKKPKVNDDESVTVRGVLYKHGTNEISNQNSFGYNTDTTACTISWHNAWELVEPEDYASSAAWLPLQKAYGEGKSASYVQKYFYEDNLAEYHILIAALSIADNWGNKNRFFSIRNITKDIDDLDPSESDRRRFVITPWDLDTGLGGEYSGKYYDGTYSAWAVKDVAKNCPYPISSIAGTTSYKQTLKNKWIEARKGTFSLQSINSKLEAYRDLFINSGAWARQAAVQPCYVADLAKEIAYVEAWYAARYREMDEYFGIDDADVPVIENCATPEIVFDNGHISFACETDNAEFHYSYSVNQSGQGTSTSLLNIAVEVTITVYATAQGYAPSKTVTRTITLTCTSQDVNGDGVVDSQDVLNIYDYMKQQ